MTPDLLPLDSPTATLDAAGGKGANLARLARLGCPVPPGFIIPVGAYHAALAAAGLDERIPAMARDVNTADPAALDALSTQIRACFTPDLLPAALSGAILAAWQTLGAPPVAVRSSATAEDLPEMSFAGQQDTYLNVTTGETLLRAVASCWGSLWTARAIAYRGRQGVGQAGLGLAVIVQQMVDSAASGVLFSANPLTGLRSETVMDAALGLGEGLVSGLVEPDHYVVDHLTGRITSKTIGAKALAVVPGPGGGVQTVATGALRQALPDEQVLALAQMGARVADDFGAPQDIEWAWDGQRLYLLQSRAITSLFPVPQGTGPDDLRVLFSFGAVQGMLDPITPLGRDVMMLLAVGGARLYGLRFTEQTQTVLREAGERLWVDVTTPVRNPVGRGVVRGALRYVEPGAHDHLLSVWDDPRLTPTTRRLRPATALRLVRGMGPMLFSLLRYMATPEKRMAQTRQRVSEVLVDFRTRLDAASGTTAAKLAARVAVLRRTSSIFKMLASSFIPGIGTGMSTWMLVRRFAGQLDRQQGGEHFSRLAMQIPRGVPGNVTTEMDLALWRVARQVRADAPSAALFEALPPAELAARWSAGALPPAAQAAITTFLDEYGLRGLAEIDLGRPRWREEPEHVMQLMAAYLPIDPADGPDVQFARAAQAGQSALDEIARAARRLPHGWLKARLVRFAGRRARAVLGIREAPKFFAVRAIGMGRLALLDSGRELVQAGVLARPDDVFYLRVSELEALAAGEKRDWAGLARERRAAYEREKSRRQLPRLLLSDGRAFYAGITGPDGHAGLRGDPVSPGLVEGAVRVVLDPRQAQLQPGEILVCPGTDPSWTPLFLAAGGLVMEVGGMMTHGAVVAREYGIPAVVGVDQATQRLQTGQRIRVDGSTGIIQVLDPGL